jgi:excinuclease ABC subunit B
MSSPQLIVRALRKQIMPQDRPFILRSEFEAAGDQPAAIDALAAGLARGDKHQTLLGVTGSGKTFTLANVLAKVNRPALIISHNKTLAAQLYSEFKHFFPENAVEYFISYYDYYLPEAYIPQTDTYIAKDASINDEIEKLRLAATSALVERRDVVLIASVSCIYGLGSPEDFARMSIGLEADTDLPRDDLLRGLVRLLYERNDIAPSRGQFQVAGDTVDIYPAYRDDLIRVEFWGDTIERITVRDGVSKQVMAEVEATRIFPAKHFMLPEERFKSAEADILAEMKEQVRKFEEAGRLVEAQRIFQRTQYDLEMMRELGYCNGIENYSRPLSGRPPGSRPYCLIDYFPDDFITIIDESHVTLPQVRGMYLADRTRKETLVDHGFRLPSALDNRPLDFEEFGKIAGQMLYVSATPAAYEIEHTVPVEQVVRPTGLLDPIVEMRPLGNQIDDLIAEVREVAARGQRVLVTTLTKQISEDLSDYLVELDVRVKYMHSDIGAIERVEILRDLRLGNFDCLVGVNLLREGLDLPEVALVAVLDADKQGFLRSKTALIQTAGRAARHIDGRVILYADKVTDAMKAMMDLTSVRRERQAAHNVKHGIIPRSVERPVDDSLRMYGGGSQDSSEELMVAESATNEDLQTLVETMRTEMTEAAGKLEFERAAMLRDQIKRLEDELAGDGEPLPY